MSLSHPTAKAEALIEALPYLQAFRGKTVLVKMGGSAMEDPELVAKVMRDIVFMEVVGINPIVVHGGGKAISAAMAEAGLEAKFVGGFRVTTEEAISIVETVLSEEINPGLVRMIRDFGGKAITPRSRSGCAPGPPCTRSCFVAAADHSRPMMPATFEFPPPSSTRRSRRDIICRATNQATGIEIAMLSAAAP